MIRHLIFRVSRRVTRLHRVPDRHPQPPLTLRRTTRRLVPVERVVESLVHPRPRGWIKRERVGRRPGLLTVAGAARIVEHHDGAERQPGSERGVDGEVRALVQVRHPGDVSHPLHRDEPPGLGLVRVEHPADLTPEHAVDLDVHVRVHRVLGVANLRPGVVRVAEDGPKGCAVPHEDDEGVLAHGSPWGDLRGVRGDLVVPPKLQRRDDVKTGGSKLFLGVRGDCLPRVVAPCPARITHPTDEQAPRDRDRDADGARDRSLRRSGFIHLDNRFGLLHPH